MSRVANPVYQLLTMDFYSKKYGNLTVSSLLIYIDLVFLEYKDKIFYLYWNLFI